MTSGDEYYGKYQKVNTNEKRHVKRKSPANYWKLWCMIILILPAIIIMCMNTYLLYETQRDYQKIKIQVKELTLLLDETHAMIKTSVRPQVDVLMSYLSYQLPSSILNAFRRSNNELTTKLGSISVDLVNLIDMYKSILGFDEEWELMPDTRHITCSFVDNHSLNENWKKVKTSRERYQKLNKNPTSERLPLDSSDEAETSGTLVTPLPTPISSINRKTRLSIFDAVINSIKDYFNSNDTYFKVYSNLKSVLTEDKSILIVNETDRPEGIRAIPPTPRMENEPTRSHSRRRRHAVTMSPIKDMNAQNKKYNYYDGSDIHIHKVVNTVPQMCSVTRQIFKFNELNCYTAHSIIEYIRCLIS